MSAWQQQQQQQQQQQIMHVCVPFQTAMPAA
jgi:hypothetical protein